MKYQNAGDLLPSALLREVRKYVPNGLLYIPRDNELPRPWGAHNGTRSYYEIRNADICATYAAGVSLTELAEKYGLSEKTIRRILYHMKESSS